MFKEPLQFRIPTKPIEAFSVQSASFGGGYIMHLTVDGRVETAVFTGLESLTSYIQFMLSGQALALGKADSPANAPTAAATTADSAAKASAPKRKGRGGRPKLSEEEKAANKAKRLALKANSHNDPAPQETPEAALAA